MLDREIHIIGLKCRTNNKAEFSENAKIGNLVNNYYQSNAQLQIPNRKNPSVTFCVYSEYESDHTGDYSFIIGEETDENATAPDGFYKIIIPKQNYKIFTSEKGKIPEIVINCWKKIWAWSNDEAPGSRSYLADFELYDSRCRDIENALMDIYIGINK